MTRALRVSTILTFVLLVAVGKLVAIGIGIGGGSGNETGNYFLNQYEVYNKWRVHVVFDTNVFETDRIDHRFSYGLGESKYFYMLGKVDELREEHFTCHTFMYSMLFPMTSEGKQRFTIGPMMILEYQESESKREYNSSYQECAQYHDVRAYGGGMGFALCYAYKLSSSLATSVEMDIYGQTMQGVRRLREIEGDSVNNDTVSYFTISSSFMLRLSLMFTMFE